jgi:hypothetical protein
MKKIILWSIVLLVVAGVAVDAFLWLRKPQIIKLSDGTKLTLMGVTYGKHHVAPKVKIAGKTIRGNGGARIDSTNNTVVVWIEAEHKPNQYPNFQLMVYDKANTACSTSGSRTQSQVKNGVDIMGFRLDAFPRRDSKLILRVMSYGQRGQQVSKEQFVISNPARGSFAKWTPDPLPNSQSDGDLNVTLTKLVAGAQLPYNRGNGVPQNDPMNKCVQIALDVQQKGQSVTNWRPIRVVTSDATGNSIQGWINDFRQNGQESGYFYQEGLWPDEPAWKLRVEFSRTSGFSDDEVWVVTNVPVGPGTQQDVWNNFGNSDTARKAAFAEATVNGIHLKLFPAIQYQDQNNGGGQSVSFSLKADPDPEATGLRLTVLKAADDQDHILQNRGSSWGGGNYQYQYSGVRNLKTLNLTFALHKSRFVEFTVKPVTAAATSNQSNP